MLLPSIAGSIFLVLVGHTHVVQNPPAPQQAPNPTPAGGDKPADTKKKPKKPHIPLTGEQIERQVKPVKEEVIPEPPPTPPTPVEPAPVAPEPAPTPVLPPVVVTAPAPAPVIVAAPPPQVVKPIPPPTPAPAVVQVAPALKVETPGGMDLRHYAAEMPPDPKHARRPWNIRPVTYYGRLDTLSFNSYTAHTEDGSSLHGSLSQHPGIGFGASIEAFPQKWGAVFFTWDYRYGFASKLNFDGPALYKLGTLDLAAQHQVSLGAHAGFRAPWSGEWSIGLEYRAEGYKVTGPSGSPSTAWLQRPWANLGARWSLNVIRDLRPFIGIDLAMPLTGAPSFASENYNRDVKNLLGIYPKAPIGTAPSTTSADAIARAHASKFQIGVVYGIRFFRPRRQWRAAIIGVQEIPTKPTDTKEYEVPKEATNPGQDKPKGKAPEPPTSPKKDN